jgi:hypothetical protein
LSFAPPATAAPPRALPMITTCWKAGAPLAASFAARAMNLLIASGAYGEVARVYPEDLIELRQGARVVERSK